ncbi:MAG TPA: DUF2203 family protein [Acidimicrobiales bacterium]|nr:DUF2203 family protein [Acidimicrobiales bacterium]
MRYWTVAEAQEYLPRLRRLLGAVQSAAPGARAPTNGHGHVIPDRADAAADDARAALAELQAGDILLRDLGMGLVDFHALGGDGTTYLLCWRTSDPDVGWWHGTDEGFANRKPLPRP